MLVIGRPWARNYFSEPLVLRKVPKVCFGGKIKRHAEVMIYIGDGRGRLIRYISRFSTDLKGLFTVRLESGRVAARSIDFGGPFVRVLRESGWVWVAAGGQVEFHTKPKFCSSRLCTVKHVSLGEFGAAGGPK